MSTKKKPAGKSCIPVTKLVTLLEGDTALVNGKKYVVKNGELTSLAKFRIVVDFSPTLWDKHTGTQHNWNPESEDIVDLREYMYDCLDDRVVRTEHQIREAVNISVLGLVNVEDNND